MPLTELFCCRTKSEHAMYITATTVDDLLRRVFSRLLDADQRVTATRGDTIEIVGVLVQLSNPRARLSRTENKQVLFSCLGELLWYLAGSRELAFIEYYLSQYERESDDGVTVHGAYGPRLFHMRGQDQVANVLSLLRARPTSRRAVIQMFDAADIATAHRDVPCTCSLQFILREGRLHLFTSMRSNDAYLGLPHDIFAFTMLQEIMARSLGVDVGTYKHAVGSLHLYKQHRKAARAFLREGWQETISMPVMPAADPWPSIQAVVKCEKALRSRGGLPRSVLKLHPYWMDMVRLLRVYRCFRDGDADSISRLKQEMSVNVFDMYIDYKRRAAQRTGSRPGRSTSH
jgi:thymidylate synthase